MGENKSWGPLTHWNNFTLPELKEIIWHCEDLERLGIAQDAEMIKSIQRDIALREKTQQKRNPKSADKDLASSRSEIAVAQ